jgi:UDP-glucose 4-epimerase
MNGPVVILGHSGFIGSAITDYLHRHYSSLKVVSPPCLDLTSEEGCQRLASLITRDSTIIICAAVKKQLGDNLETFHANLAIAENLCRVFGRQPPARILYFSSAAVYGEASTNLDINEATPIDPSTYYGIGKFAMEKLLEKTLEDKPVSIAILRPPLIYGAGDESRGYGPTGFVWNALHGDGSVTLWGEGDELREFVFIDDAAAIASEFALGNFEGIVNLASGASHTFREALELVSHHRPVHVRSRPRSKARIDQTYDNSRLRMLFPGFRFTPLQQGIARTFELLAPREPA